MLQIKVVSTIAEQRTWPLWVGGWVVGGLSSDRVFVVVSVQSQCLDFNLNFKINLRGEMELLVVRSPRVCKCK